MRDDEGDKIKLELNPWRLSSEEPRSIKVPATS